MRKMLRRLLCTALLFTGCVQAQITVRSGAGANPAALTPTRDQFRVDLGGGTSASANGSFGGLRREINWDATPATSSAPNSMANNFFNVNSPRGVVLVPGVGGTGFQVSGNASDSGPGQPAGANFGNLNLNYSGIFQTFTPSRLITSLGNNIFDVTFFVPGTSVPAVVTGFGAVFADVDLAGTTALQFFAANGVSLGAFAASPSGSGLSFLGGFVTGRPTIASVRVTLGNTAIGPNDNNGSSDIVVLDDFIYGEPREVSLFADGFE